MVSIKRKTTKLLVSLERIFLNYHKHPQNSLQWISGFGASSSYSSVVGQSLPWRAVLWEQWELSPPWAGSLNSDGLGGLTVPEKKGGNSHYPLSSLAILPSCCMQLGLFTQRSRETMFFILNSLQTRRPWLFYALEFWEQKKRINPTKWSGRWWNSVRRGRQLRIRCKLRPIESETSRTNNSYPRASISQTPLTLMKFCHSFININIY